MAASEGIRTDDSLHILVIEDERKLADAIAEGLAGSGYRATIAHSGEAGLEDVRNHAIDVILLDLMLPRHGGLETLRELRRCGISHRSISGLEVQMIHIVLGVAGVPEARELG